MQIKNILEQAHGFFIAKKYDKALFLYAQASSLKPRNAEYQLYSIFCDIASENPTKGQSLFDYFTIASNENKEEAIKDVMEMIVEYDSTNEQLTSILQEISTQTIESLDAIQYEDFKKLIEKRGSFKIAFQDIMFSTKVAITTKEDFCNFVDQLIENNFETTAYHYLDGFNEYFKYDKKIMELYNKLGSKSIELHNK